MNELWPVMGMLLVAFLGALGALMFKQGSAKFSFNKSGLIFNKQLLLGLFLYSASVLTFVQTLKGGELTVLYPIGSTTYIWTAFFSIKFLHEKMNIYKYIGMASVIFGVFLIGFV